MSLVTDLLVCLRFFSRLPLPAAPVDAEHGPAALARAAPMAPVAGALIGLAPALTLLGATLVGLSPFPAAILAVATLVWVTGALHEDGLADCADGFGGGTTRERKLEIMRDSRIGTFGTCALVLSLLLRIAALADATSIAPLLAAVVLVFAASLSRALCLVPLVLLAPARDDGLGASNARLPAPRIAVALTVALGLAVAANLAVPAPSRFASAVVLATAAVLGVCALAWRQIRGQTGDVAGAAQQVAELAVLLVFAAGPT